MKLEDLIKQLEIRFNTEPKKYEKEDFGVLIKVLRKLLVGIFTNEISIGEVKQALQLYVSELSESISNLDSKVDNVYNTLDSKIDTEVTNLNDTIEQTSNNLSTLMASNTNMLEGKIASSASTLESKIVSTSNDLESKITKLSQDTVNSIATQVENRNTAINTAVTQLEAKILAVSDSLIEMTVPKDSFELLDMLEHSTKDGDQALCLYNEFVRYKVERMIQNSECVWEGEFIDLGGIILNPGDIIVDPIPTN